MIHYKANSTKYILFATGFWHNTGDGINFPFLLCALTCFWPSVALRTFDTHHFFMTVHFGNIQPGLIIITIAKLGKKCWATGKKCWAIAAIYARWSFRWFHSSCQRYPRSDPMERLFGYIILLRLNSTIEILIRPYLRNWTYVQFQEQLTGTHSVFMWSTLQNRKKVN